MSEQVDQSTLSEVHHSHDKKLKISVFEPVMGIIISLIATIVFLGFPHIITVVLIGGPVIPTFYEDIIRSLWIPIVLWLIFRLVVDVSYLVERKYTKRLANIALVGNLLTAICTFIIFISIRIVNIDFINFVYDYYGSIAMWFANILARPNLIILVIIMIVLILESINVYKKGYKSKKKEEELEKEAEQSADAHSEQEKDTRGRKFSYFEPFKGIILTVIVTAIFLGSPGIIAFVFYDRLIPTFVTEVIRSLWIPIILWALLRIGIEVAYLIERKYTKRLAIITTIGDVLAIICGFIIFVSPRIVNVEYTDFVHRYFDDMAAWFSVILTRILESPNLIVLVVMIVVLVVESINMFRRSIKSGDNDEDEEEVKRIPIDIKTETDGANADATAEEVKADIEETKAEEM